MDGFQVVSAELVGGEWQLAVQTVATVIGGSTPPSVVSDLAVSRSGESAT